MISIVCLIAGLLFLMALMLIWKIHPVISILVVSVILGFSFGMDGGKILSSLQNGVGSTLSGIVLLLTFGGIFGKVLSSSGAADKISEGLVELYGKNRVQWSMLTTAFLIGLPMFYTAGFVVLLPIIFSVVRKSGLPLLYVAIPAVSALSVTHGFLPPHPGPSAIAVIFKADLGITMVYGFIIAVPTVIIAGPLFGRLLMRFDKLSSIKVNDPGNIAQVKSLPGFQLSLAAALFPIVLITSAAVVKILQPDQTSAVLQAWVFLGEPLIALLLGIFFSVIVLSDFLPKGKEERNQLVQTAMESIAGILLIIAAGGAFKQILVDSGVAGTISSGFRQVNFPPLVVGWSLSALLRICLGSSTVAALTSAAMVGQYMGPETSKELMVLAVGAGSLTASHVNDAGFWMFKEYFGLNIPQTLMSWTVMETIVSVLGLVGVLVLDLFV